MDYFIVTVRDNKVDDVVDIFYNVNSDSTYGLLKKVLDKGSLEITEIIQTSGSNMPLEPKLSRPEVMPTIFNVRPGSVGNGNEFKEGE